MQRLYKWPITLLVFLLVITGCNNTASVSTGSSGDEKVLTIGNTIDNVTFDVHDHGNTQTESIHVNLFEYLVKKDASDPKKKLPGLAVSWERTDDLTWRFILREGVTFHNGDPFTAEDVKFTLERVARDKSLIDYPSYNIIDRVEIKDDHTVDIITKEPDPILLSRLSRISSGILPAKYFQEKGVEGFNAAPVGTGPYKFDQWIKDDRVELVKNENYYAGEPKWDRVIFRTIPESTTRISELLTGSVDIAVIIPPGDIQRVKDSGKTYYTDLESARVQSLLVRQTPGTVTADPKVREAIELAIDKQTLVDSVLEGAGVPTQEAIGPGILGFNPDLFNTNLYDPERAKQLLVEAGYPNGVELTLSSPTSTKEVAEAIAAYLTEANFKVNLEILEQTQYKQRDNSNTFKELALQGKGNSMFEAPLQLEVFKSDNAKGQTDYNNPEVDELLTEASVNLDDQKREAQYQKVQSILAEERPRIFLYQNKFNYGVSNRIDFAPRADEMFFAEDITLKE
ncbi:ABC transporter substrate-binding protein [Paenibacillus barcinonensis]|uniref:ABC transporter substrate-binding protein n=1 Tax=Paenibacillus barcinonensis TaxID=198119 RepID=UPI001C1213D9|nr:ABC transporter substrate-binding protein [Paenibacillus barcinonensis]MBU5353406.1 ABC transporter substrate-binding protein [Paenibacillus barcinonensis]